MSALRSHPHVNPWLIAIIVAIATFMEVLDTSIANVALPHIAGSISAGQDESTWVLTSYLVSNAIILPISGWLSSVLGRKRFYIICVMLFTISSLACGMATSLGMLVFFRVLQGLGGGGLQPTSQAIMADTFEPRKRGMAFAIYGMAAVVAPALGPTLGGWITDNFDWRWIFFINIPVGIISILLTAQLVHDPDYLTHQRKEKSVDYTGLGFIALGLGTLQIILDKGQREDWFESRFIVSMTALCVLSLVAAVVWELRVKAPVVDLRLLKERNFATANVLMFILGFVLMGSTVLLPQFLQSQMGYTATHAGMVLSPGSLEVLFLLPIVGMLLSKGVPPKFLIVFGLIMGASGLFLMRAFNLQVDFYHATISRCVQAVGFAFLFVPVNTMAYSYLPPGKNNLASGLLNLSRNIGGGVGIAFATTMLERRAQFHQNVLSAHANPYDPAFVERLTSIQNGLIAQGMSAIDAATRSMALMYQSLAKQAAMLSYIDNFHLMALVFLGVIPLVLITRTPKHAAAPSGAH